MPTGSTESKDQQTKTQLCTPSVQQNQDWALLDLVLEGPAKAGSGADADGDAESDIGRAIAAGDAETSGGIAGMERSNEIQFTDETKRLSRQTD